MKKTFAILTAALLVTSVLVPSAAVAAKGGSHRGSGNGRASAPGQVKKISDDATVEASLEVENPEAFEEASESPAKGKGNGNSVAAGKPEHAADDHASENGTSTARVRDRERVQDSAEGSSTLKPKRTGIANAYDRISANLDRASAKISKGTKKSVPPGLVRVVEKFFGWLGLESGDAADDADTNPPVDTPDASDDDTVTPVPDSDADTSTPTPEPGVE